MTIDVRPALVTDHDQVVDVLAAAFLHDPAMGWIYTDATKRRRGLERYFRFLVANVYHPKQGVLVTGDLAGIALCAPPGRWGVPLGATARLGTTMLPDIGLRVLPRTLGSARQMDGLHRRLRAPHWYLAFVGVAPASSGGGRGSALLRAVTERADDDGVGCYLEATSARNAALYHRHGFVPIDTMHWPGGGPEWFPMTRGEMELDA